MNPEMDTAQVLRFIQDYTARLCNERGLPAPEIGDGTILLGDSLGMDSLDLATLVFELQEATGHDPFEEGFIHFRTAGELARLFGAAVQ